MTAVHVAAAYGQIDCLTTLIEHGADVNAWAGDWGTPLHRAVLNGHTKCVTALLRHGADASSRSRIGDTSLHKAARRGHVDCFEKLVQSGADTTLKNYANKTAIDVADESTKQQMQHIVNNNKWTLAKAVKQMFGRLQSKHQGNANQVQQVKAGVSDVRKAQTVTNQRVDDVTNSTAQLQSKIQTAEKRLDQLTKQLEHETKQREKTEEALCKQLLKTEEALRTRITEESAATAEKIREVERQRTVLELTAQVIQQPDAIHIGESNFNASAY